MNRHLKALTLVLATVCTLQVAMASSPDSTQVCKRLATIEGQIPLPYHPALKTAIQTYEAKPLPAEFVRYDSLIIQELRNSQLPEELRFMPLALSGMNPNHYQDGRAGVWDLPALVALRYGLIVNEHHDERYAVKAATQAALHYLKDLHAVTGDWWTTLLAYANSPAAVNQIKARHPGQKIEPWDYATQRWLDNTNLIGDFIACNYVYQGTALPVAQTEETVSCPFDQPISLSALSTYTDVPKKIIMLLNPLFRSDPYLPLAAYPITLPKTAKEYFEVNLEQIYNETVEQVAQKEEEKVKTAETQEKAKEVAKAKAQKESKFITYTVKKGDTLNKIAAKYHVKVKDIKKWNKLKGDLIREKQKLKIYQ
ncbi:MAG: LysM peptidoglycan-binding domain-containing protein [Bacteroidales bacterium]|nr:LysM peptidoglycan-binding domain-containing protein [Bacteroidales bacterium]